MGSAALLVALAACSSPKGGGTPSFDGTDTGAQVPVARADLQLRFPLVEPELFDIVTGVDHDPVVQEAGIMQLVCLDYLGRAFPHCYDEHKGTDFLLSGSFDRMDDGSATIVAAADGEVIWAEDGHYDRCHGNLETGTNDCDGYDMIANSVVVAHARGETTWYWHMLEGSVAVALGDGVRAGDVLGRVGSSGNSYQPHLHFEVQEPGGVVVDPYAGPYSQEETWWCDQGDPDGLPGLCE